MDKEQKKLNGQSTLEITNIKAEIAMRIIKYSLLNGYDYKVVANHVLGDMEEMIVDGVKKYEKLCNSGNYKEAMEAIKRQNAIHAEKLRNGDF